MTRKKLLSVLLLFASVCLADSGVVTLFYTNDDDGKARHSEHPVPVVSYDNDDVSITCDSVMPNVMVVVLDEDMRPIYGNVMTLSATPSTFTVHNIYKEKYMIQLYTEDRHLYGYFHLY